MTKGYVLLERELARPVMAQSNGRDPDAWLTTNTPQAMFEIVSPEMAARWLGRNFNNRPLKPSKIAKMSRDRINGHWQINGEAIKFDRLGRLRDGQNRLTMVCQTGLPITALIVTGLEPDAAESMDMGTPRSPADTLDMRGVKNSRAIASVAACFEAWRSGHFRHAMVHANPTYTNAEIADVVERWPVMIEASAATRRLRNTLPLPHGAVAATYTRFASIDADACTNFFDRIAELRTTGAGDPVNTLLKRASDEKRSQARIWNSTAVFFMVRAWNADRSGERLRKFQIGSEHSGWATIPEPL